MGAAWPRPLFLSSSSFHSIFTLLPLSLHFNKLYSPLYLFSITSPPSWHINHWLIPPRGGEGGCNSARCARGESAQHGPRRPSASSRGDLRATGRR